MPRPKGDPKRSEFQTGQSTKSASEQKQPKVVTLSPSELGLTIDDYEVKGMVQAVAAKTRGKNYSQRSAASNLYASSASGTAQVGDEARQEALKKLETNAGSAYKQDMVSKIMVVGVRFDSAQSEDGIVEVCAYGTVIQLKM